jgi:hypothetical protein
LWGQIIHVRHLKDVTSINDVTFCTRFFSKIPFAQ